MPSSGPFHESSREPVYCPWCGHPCKRELLSIEDGIALWRMTCSWKEGRFEFELVVRLGQGVDPVGA